MHWGNFLRAWQSEPFGLYYVNSLWTTLAIVILQLITSTMAAYALVFVPFRGSKLLFAGIMLALMVPMQATFIPNFLILRDLHWLDSYMALIVPFAGSAFGIFLMRQAYLTFPKEMVEAMRIDGGTEWQILWRLIVPNVKPQVISLVILSFVFHYNNLFWPLVVTNSTKYRVLPLGLATFLQQQGGNGPQWNLMMAADLFTMLPLLVVFFFGQRYLVQTVANSGIK